MKLRYSFLIGFVALITVVGSAQSKKMVVAINKFENEANAPSERFNSLRSRITDNIINTRKFEVVERQRLEAAMSENKLKAAGATEDDVSQTGGQLKAAGFILYGSVLSMGRDQGKTSVSGLSAQKNSAKVELQMRFANGENGKIVASKTIIGKGFQSRMAGGGLRVKSNMEDQAINDAIRDAAKKVTEALMELAFPAKILKVSKTQAIVNLTKEQTEIGAVYEVFMMGEDLVDPDTGESLGAEEELIGKVEVARTMPKVTYMKPIGDTDIDDLVAGMTVRRQDEKLAEIERKKQKQKAVKNFESRF